MKRKKYKLFPYYISAMGLLLLSTLMLSGQQNFLPGYIVSNNEDTIKGWIDYKDWEKNPDAIKFKQDNGQTFHYNPGDFS